MGAMNSAPAFTFLRRLAPRRAMPSRTLVATLAPAEPVRALDCAPGCRATLQVLSGHAWITQHGEGDDWFLEPGQRLALPGPGRLYAGTDGPEPLQLRWVVEPASPHGGTPEAVRAAA